jgi:NAD(P)-dependent dehydrogenase (short-subunit alcohol dehydrogenase family)
LNLARCLAEEGGALGIRVNTVNPDAVLQGSGIWNAGWREARAKSMGVAPNQLEEAYQQRNTLKVSIYPEDIAEAILFFASDRSSKTTGGIVNVDGGVTAAYVR